MINRSILNLIQAISEGDTVASGQLFNEAMMAAINEKVEAKHKEVASNISIALKDKNIHVRIAAAKHPNATKEHLKQAITDPHLHVRLAALANPRLDAPVEKKEKKEEKTNADHAASITQLLGKIK